jgi:DNA modification methylase
MQINQTRLDKLIPYINNARTHSDEQIAQIAASIKEFGFNNPVLIDKHKGIIAGHGRVCAARILGLDTVPTIELSHLSEAKKKAYILADNRLAMNAGWDIGLLKLELDDIIANDIDPLLLGFGEDEMDAILNPAVDNEGLCDPDDVPEPAAEVITKPGDIWLLGKHRVMCGDSTQIDVVNKLMAGEKADMVFTDPPYGVNFQQGKFIGRDKKGKNRHFDSIENDDKQGKDLEEFIRQCLTNAIIVSNTAAIYLWSPPLLEGFYILSAAVESGWHIQSQIIWNKTPFVIGRADYHWKHEVCWYGYVGEKHQWHGGRDKSTIWDVAKVQSSDLHPTMKPIELAVTACNNSTKPNNIVLDLFGGSGSTLIGCEKTNRKCYMMEISPQYCDVIIRRWMKFTGKEARLESTNQLFSEIANGEGKEKTCRRKTEMDAA